MSRSEREQLEGEVRGLCQSGDAARAATAAIRGYGPEIFGFVRALCRNEQDADEVFSIWSERLWRGLGGFGWECSLRTWAYAIARNATSNFRRGARHRAQRQAPLSDVAELSRIEQQVRSETLPYLRTEVKSKLAELRDALAPEDRALLILRVDKGLAWKDLARVMLGDDATPTDEALTRESQRLRKRFQLIKDKLVEAGKREGLLDGERGGGSRAAR